MSLKTIRISHRSIKAEYYRGIKFEYYEFQNGEGFILHLTIYITRPNRKRKFKNPLKYLLFRPTNIIIRIDDKEISGAIEIKLNDEEKYWIVKYLSSLEYSRPEVKIFLDEFEDRAE